jgi:dienelactone hydrolase
VLVFPEAFGPGEHAIFRARSLAAMGYVALACDLHGDGRVVGDLEEAVGLLKPLFEDPERTRARAKGGLQALVALSEVDAGRVASIGFCFGGTMSLELARARAALKRQAQSSATGNGRHSVGLRQSLWSQPVMSRMMSSRQRARSFRKKSLPI